MCVCVFACRQDAVAAGNKRNMLLHEQRMAIDRKLQRRQQRMTIDRKLQRRDWEVSYARDEPAYDYY